ncbi:NAD/NADP octopine/nopaline dehydrogenase family protein [Porticoccus sp. W117]|uniref:NAD/NADP octopine/nopaline dehydrogenase family protein n=1 Tax=Porticoccus sp. W117 TaxID=3054777 RepID=UPI0025972E83|nr:NAD/NADP octopine/nopaline dehydrogenase family protein [Porticoccus sp. W117]
MNPTANISINTQTPTVCIIGGGNAAHVLAALLPSRGISTRVLATFGDEAERMANGVAEQGHISAEFAEHNPVKGTVNGKPEIISANPTEVIPGSDVLLLPLPSFAYQSVLETIKPHLKPGMAIGVTPGQGGFDWVAREVLGDLVDQLVLFAILPMPFNCRITDYGKQVEVQEFKHNYRVGVLPTSATNDIIALNEKLFGHTESCGHFLSATLYPVNAILHPSRLYTLCKDWQPGQTLPENPLFYEGMTEAAADMMNALNKDLIAIGNGLVAAGKEAIEVPHIYDFLTRYVYEDNSPDLATFFRTNPAYKGFRCPFKEVEGGWEPDFANRYFTEDIPLGLCVYKGVADLASVATPTIDTVITWAQQHMGKEYVVDGKLCGRDVGETHAPQRFGITELAQL